MLLRFKAHQKADLFTMVTGKSFVSIYRLMPSLGLHPTILHNHLWSLNRLNPEVSADGETQHVTIVVGSEKHAERCHFGAFAQWVTA
jgi:hypothetical protein